MDRGRARHPRLGDVLRAGVKSGDPLAPHIAGKEDLLIALVERALAENERHMHPAYAADALPLDRLLAAASAYLRFCRESPQRFRLVAQQLNRPDGLPGTDKRMAPRLAAMTESLAGVIADGVADGSFREVPPLETARFLWGMNG